jgi:hypothetical protein
MPDLKAQIPKARTRALPDIEHFYPEIISNQRGELEGAVQGPYLPARGVVLIGLDEP